MRNAALSLDGEPEDGVLVLVLVVMVGVNDDKGRGH